MNLLTNSTHRLLGTIAKFVKENPRRAVILTALFWTGIFSLLIIFANRLAGTDDYVFQQQIKPYPTLFGWIDYRYHTWSGRFFSEAFMYLFSPAPLALWKSVSIALYGAFVFFGYKIYKLFSIKATSRHDIISLSLLCAVPYLMNAYVFYDATLWVTGSMGYFWIAVFGLTALYPPLFTLTSNTLPKWRYMLIGIVSATIASCSQEQVGLILTTFILIIFIMMVKKLTRNKKTFVPLIYTLIILIICATSLLLSITAPGDRARTAAEITRWLPDFQTISLSLRTNYSVRWFLDAVINHTGFLLPLLWLGLVPLVLSGRGRYYIRYISTGCLILLTIITMLRGYAPFVYLFDFQAQWGLTYFPPASLALLLFWVIALFFTLLLPFLTFKDKGLRWLVPILFSASLASTGIITLSPTMYASGWRTLYVPSLLIGSIIVVVYSFHIQNSKRVRIVQLRTKYLVGFMLLLTSIQVSYLFLRTLLNGHR